MRRTVLHTIRKEAFSDMGTLSPYPWDLPRSCHPMWHLQTKYKTGDKQCSSPAWSGPGVGARVAIPALPYPPPGPHPCTTSRCRGARGRTQSRSSPQVQANWLRKKRGESPEPPRRACRPPHPPCQNRPGRDRGRRLFCTPSNQKETRPAPHRASGQRPPPPTLREGVSRGRKRRHSGLSFRLIPQLE